ncbi:MAG: ABC transporter ATP-binding protein [Acidobacteriota bacterium]|nr:ABC transporter ATP-binding protein [Acidobacteriota bacterium]
MGSAPLLDISHLAIGFGGQNAVHDLSLTIAPGQTAGLVGESGSGKSLTSLAVLGLLPSGASASGSIRFAGQPLLGQPEPVLRRLRGREIAMIFQEPMTALNPVMTIGDQIAEAILAHPDTLPHLAAHRSTVRERVVQALQQVALPEPERRLRHYPHQFSGGQRQRILIAMALVHRPRLLIADEPTTALDVTVQAQILELLAQLRHTHNLAMLFISHDLAVVARACNQPGDTVTVLQQGRVVEQAPARQLFLAPGHAYTQRLLASVPTLRTDRLQPLATLRQA